MERYDLVVRRGETFRRVLRLKKGGEAMDLTGWTGKAQIRPEPDSAELVCEMELTIVPEEGKVVMIIPLSVTEGISSGVYSWDIRLTDDEGIARYYTGGAVKVMPTVTK